MAQRAARRCRSFWKRAAVGVAVLFVVAVALAGAAAVPAAAADSGAPPPVGSEIDSLRTADSNTFVGADGTLVAHVYRGR